MLKIRLQGTMNDIKWFLKILSVTDCELLYLFTLFSEVKLAQNVSDLNHLMLNEFFPTEKCRINGEKS